MNVCIYIRCSTDMQEDSPEVQRAIVNAYCKREGHSIVAEYVDEAVTGGMPIAQRPNAHRMLADAKEGRFDAVVAKQLDRLGRNAADSIGFLEICKRHKVQLLFAQESYADTPAGRLNFNIIAVLAQYYREDIGEKIRDHNVWVARSGRWCGGQAPFGYRYDKERKLLVPDPAKAADCLTLFRVFVESNGSREGTAKRLNALGIPGPCGTLWAGIRVKRVIDNPIYDGRLRYWGEEYETAGVEPIVPAELVTQARYLSATTARHHGGQGNADESTYTGILRCGVCGARIWGSHPPDPKRGITRAYRCMAYQKYRSCDNPGISESRLDNLIVPAVGSILSRYRERLLELEQQEVEQPPVPRSQSLDALEASRQRVLSVYADGIIDRALFEKQMSEIEERIRRAREVQAPPPTWSLDVAADVIDNLPLHWPGMTVQEKRGILLNVTPMVVLVAGKVARGIIHSPLLDEPLEVENYHYRGRHYDTPKH